MPIDERLRAGLAANTEHLLPDVERALTGVVRRAQHRARVRTAGVAAVAAAVLAVLAWLGGLPGLDRASEPVAPAPTPTQPKQMAGIDGALEPGRYAVPLWAGDSEHLPQAVVDVPAGYGSPGGWVVDRGADGDPENYGSVSFWTVEDVLTDPCDVATGADPGPTVRDLARALRDQPGQRTTRPAPTALDGHRGLYLEIALPRGADLSGCSDGERSLFATDGARHLTQNFPGQVHRLWILDVDGLRVVVDVSITPSEDATASAELLGIAASTHFVDHLPPD